jgi:hypothetical protein
MNDPSKSMMHNGCRGEKKIKKEKIKRGSHFFSICFITCPPKKNPTGGAGAGAGWCILHLPLWIHWRDPFVMFGLDGICAICRFWNPKAADDLDSQDEVNSPPKSRKVQQRCSLILSSSSIAASMR